MPKGICYNASRQERRKCSLWHAKSPGGRNSGAFLFRCGKVAYQSNNNVVYSCKYHVVWCPKYRRKVLTNGVDVRLKELLTEYAANLSVDILEMEIMPDHVHMLLEVDPQFGIHKAVKSFKGYTSRILRQEFPYLKTKMPTLWTNSYFVSTVGGAPLEAVKQYIENQKTSQRQKDKMG